MFTYDPLFEKTRAIIVYRVYRISYNFKFEAKSIPRNQKKRIEPSNGKKTHLEALLSELSSKFHVKHVPVPRFFETTLVLVVGSPIRKFASPAMLHSSTVQQLRDSQPLAITDYWVHLKRCITVLYL